MTSAENTRLNNEREKMRRYSGNVKRASMSYSPSEKKTRKGVSVYDRLCEKVRLFMAGCEPEL